MLTPQDIQNKELTKAVFGGYDMTVVDDFLEDVAEDYANLYKENSVLKSKIKVLVEKVEEYRTTEDAMRMALLTAQKMSDDLLVEAKQKSNDLLSDADRQIAQKLSEMNMQLKAEENRLNAAKERTNQFVKDAEAVIKRYAEFVANIPTQMNLVEAAEQPKAEPVFYEPAPAPVKPVPTEITEQEIVDTAKEIDANVAKLFGDDTKTTVIVEEDTDQTKLFKISDSDTNWEDDDEPTSPRPKFNFDDLKFGSNYDKD